MNLEVKKEQLLSLAILVVGISAANASLNSLLGIHIDLKNSQNVDSGNYLKKSDVTSSGRQPDNIMSENFYSKFKNYFSDTNSVKELTK